MASPSYDCLQCPAYCCSYDHIPVSDADIRRIAAHFAIPPEQAKKKFTKKGDAEHPRVLRHRHDTHFASTCRFLDSETRRCSIYKARPAICRRFPAAGYCGYYAFLAWERENQDDPDWIALTS